MPSKSKAQHNLMAGCCKNPGSMKGKCPPKDVACEYMHKDAYRYRNAGEMHRDEQRVYGGSLEAGLSCRESMDARSDSMTDDVYFFGPIEPVPYDY